MRKIAILLFAIVAAANADIVTVSVTAGATGFTEPPYPTFTGDYNFDVPQFDPSLGTLLSVSYSYASNQTITFGWNDLALPAGEQFQVAVAHQLDGSFGSFSSTSMFMETTTGGNQIGMGIHIPDLKRFTSSGTFDPAPFIGTGTYSFLFAEGSGDASEVSGAPSLPVLAVEISDSDILDLTYTYATVPEPSIFMLLVGFLLVVFCCTPKSASGVQ